jgi:hypothetical protein
MKAFIHSLKKDGKHIMGEIDAVERIEGGSNEFIATIDGKRYSAIYNPFVGAFFVDDIYGKLVVRNI